MMLDIEEDDYMSDNVLPVEENKKKKRKRDEVRKNNAQFNVKSIKEINEERLKIPIKSDNIGFKLLSSMGYRPGASIGSRGGITEPIPIVLKPDRKGLGMREIEIEKEKLQLEMLADLEQRREEDSLTSLQKFNTRLQKKMDERNIHHLLYKSVKTCRLLDERMNMSNSLLVNLEQLENEARDSNPLGTFMNEIFNLSIEKQKSFLESLLLYMRNVHLYCLFCGHVYTNLEEMNANCPGVNEEDHELF